MGKKKLLDSDEAGEFSRQLTRERLVSKGLGKKGAQTDPDLERMFELLRRASRVRPGTKSNRAAIKRLAR